MLLGIDGSMDGRWMERRGDWPPRHKLCVKESDGLRRELESTKAAMLFLPPFVLEYVQAHLDLSPRLSATATATAY